MPSTPVIIIFDIGKTNKKVFAFDSLFRIISEKTQYFEEITDDDGFPCDDIDKIGEMILITLQAFLSDVNYDIQGINFATYGATLVFAGENGKPVAPVYNYLKPYPDVLKKKFYGKYGGETGFSYRTASPVLGSLNSGLMLYRIMHEKPAIFRSTKYALHLPQYISSLLTGRHYSDLTSIGCHTGLWDFEAGEYHEWVHKEGVIDKLAPIKPSSHSVKSIINGQTYRTGIGLHDSSSALIPYLKIFSHPFVLISTGTWCISMNPFNNTPLTREELETDCLCFISYEGKPVKASRLFAGQEHEEQIRKIGDHFNKRIDYYKSVRFHPGFVKNNEAANTFKNENTGNAMLRSSAFQKRNLNDFDSYEVAYHQLIADIVSQQVYSTDLVLRGAPVKKIFVDGGFSGNDVYMNLLALSYSGLEVYSATVAQASALGAALVMQREEVTGGIPTDIIQLRDFPHV